MWFGEELVFVGSSPIFLLKIACFKRKSRVWLFQAPCLLLSNNAIPIPPSVHTMALPWVKASRHQRWNRRNQFQLWKLVGKKDNENQCQSYVQILIFNCWAQHAFVSPQNTAIFGDSKFRKNIGLWDQSPSRFPRKKRKKKQLLALTTAELEPKGADHGWRSSVHSRTWGRA